MEKYKYLLFNCIFFLPPIVYTVARHKKVLWKNKVVVLFATLFGLVGFFLVDPLAVIWKAWTYDYHTTLGIIFLGGAVIEELLWALFVGFMMGCVVVIFAEQEENKKLKKKLSKR